ncbi:hypothetical protein HU200_012937 [Digitaria exilis]|uniref:Uncharacterized protein n=1 Tax=Digitaria exilis TaxID=1010633 RepID=A0A835FDW4_9POAL|nr:hypothetical protein HU200_012937 [Digitaria exilis]
MSMDTTHIFLLTNPNSMERKCTTCDLSISTRGNMRMWRGRRSGVLASHTAAYHDEVWQVMVKPVPGLSAAKGTPS